MATSCATVIFASTWLTLVATGAVEPTHGHAAEAAAAGDEVPSVAIEATDATSATRATSDRLSQPTYMDGGGATGRPHGASAMEIQ